MLRDTGLIAWVIWVLCYAVLVLMQIGTLQIGKSSTFMLRHPNPPVDTIDATVYRWDQIKQERYPHE